MLSAWKNPNKKSSSANAESKVIVPETSEDHHKRVKEISEYLDFYDSVPGSLLEREEHRTLFNQKARAKPKN